MSSDSGPIHGFPEPKLEALVEVMYLAAAADGEFSDVEREHFVGNLESLTDGRLNRERLDSLLARAESDLEAQGREARLASVKERLPDAGSRRVALSLAVQLMAADGVIRTSERELILETAEALEIDRDDAADLVKSVTR
jgi:tellurite resistance protein